MEEGPLTSVIVHHIRRGWLRHTYTLLRVPKSMMLLDLYKIIAEEANQSKKFIAAELQAFDKRRIGSFNWRKHTFTSDFPNEKPKFVLDKSNPKNTIEQCGITEDGTELMFVETLAD